MTKSSLRHRILTINSINRPNVSRISSSDLEIYCSYQNRQNPFNGKPTLHKKSTARIRIFFYSPGFTDSAEKLILSFRFEADLWNVLYTVL